MRTIPTEVLLSWPAPNYTNPATRGGALIVVNAIFIALVLLVVSLRLYTRLVIKRWFGADDVFIILAVIFTVGLTIVVLLANVRYGWSRHVYDIPFWDLASTSKIAMAAKVVFTAASTFTRLSLLCFYYRLVNDSGKKGFVWAVRGSAAFVTAIGIIFIFLSIFQCNPVRNYWIFGAPAHTCLDEGKVTLAAGVVNCVADALCTVLPMPMVMKLQMPFRQRVAVNILFGLGFIVTIAGVVRTYYIYESLIAEYDETWFAYPLWIAAAVEIDLGVICASAPVLRPLLSKIPFSLSTIASKITTNASGSKRFSAKLSANKNVSGTTLQNSRSQKSTTDSKRRSKPILRALDTQDEITQDYELRQWNDVERGLHTRQRDSTDGSQDAILGSDDERESELHRIKPSEKRGEGEDLKSRDKTSNSGEEGVELDRVSTKSSDAVGAAHHGDDPDTSRMSRP